MGYVEHLLRVKRNTHLEGHLRAIRLGETENAESYLKIMSELDYVLGMLDSDETYQKY